MLLVIAIMLFIGGAVAVTSNPDTFSPAKFFLAFYLLFHVGAFIEPPSTIVTGLIAVPLFLALIVSFGEATKTQYLPKAAQVIRPPLAPHDDYRPVAVLWLFSAPAVFAQIYMIDQIGGIEAYVASIAMRVADWSGYGWARVLISIMSTLNVAYFALGLTRRRAWVWWAIYAAHFGITFALGLASGSRGGMLNIIALLAITLHYVRRPVSMPLALGLVSFLIAAASLFGVARTNLKIQDGQLTTGLANSTSSFSLNSFFYGIEPLDFITRMPQLILANGSTFFSLITNAIPREIYPDKPDTGGVFFTVNYAGDAWLGLSNLTPTFQGEWIINFGYLAGIVGFFLSYGLLFFGLLRWYGKLLRNPHRKRDRIFAVDLAIYLHAVWTSVGLLVGEFTNITLGFILTQLIPLLGLRFCLNLIPDAPERGRQNTAPVPHIHGYRKMGSGLSR